MGRTVVTGGAGFLGSHLCERLLDDGDEVVCLDNFLTGTPANVEHLLERDGFRLISADVTEYVHVPGPVDNVLHFASPASPIDYLQLPIETLKVGSIGTLHTLGLAKEKGARYLLASTSETYGDPKVHPQPETYWGHVNPVGPRGVYDEAKRFAEAMTMAYRRYHNVDTAIVRIFNTSRHRGCVRTTAARSRTSSGRRFAASRSRSPATARRPARSSTSTTSSRACMRLLRSGHPGPMNIGNPHEVSMLELADDDPRPVRVVERDRVHPAAGGRPDDPPAGHQRSRATVLGWEPKVDCSTRDWAGRSPTSASTPRSSRSDRLSLTSRSASSGARARNALPRWLIASFSSA